MKLESVSTELREKLLKFPACDAPFWSRGGHRQTLAGHFFWNENKKYQSEQVDIPLSHGDVSHCYLYRGKSKTVVALFHGLSGNTDSAYITRLANQLYAQEHSFLLVNHRGAHSEFPLSQHIYHSGRSGDISEIIKWLRQKFPNQFLITAGFSMSGNIVLLNACGVDSVHWPDFAISVNGAIDLAHASMLLDRGFNQIYAQQFTYDLTRSRNVPGWPMRIRTLDERVTAPMAGYKNADEYYRQCSAKLYVQQMKIPTLVVTAEDDPFVPVQTYREASWSEKAILRIEKHGGHLGYVQKPKNLINDKAGQFLPLRKWMDQYFFYVIKELELQA